MVGGQNEGVGEVAAVLDQSTTSVAPDKRLAGGNHRDLLKVSDREAGGTPAVDSENGCLDMAQKGLVDRHIPGGGVRAIEQEADWGGHSRRLR